MSLLNLCEQGFSFIRYITKGEKPLEYNTTDKKELTIIKKLIYKSTPSAELKAFCSAVPTIKNIQKRRTVEKLQQDL